MGTGSFGGGSGSLGGGGGGGGGGGATGSLLRSINYLLDLSKRLRQDRSQAHLTKEVLTRLEDRARAAHIKDVLRSDFTNGVLSDLLTLGQRVRDGASWSDVAADFNVSSGPGTATLLADTIIDRNLEARSYSVDERFVDRSTEALRSFIRAAVGDNLAVFSRGNSKAIDKAISRDHFRNTIGGFLAGLLTACITADTVHDIGEALPSVTTAVGSVANATYDRFATKFVDRGRAERSEALRVIADHYSELVHGK